MRLSILVAGSLALSVLFAPPMRARAETVDTQVGNTFSDGGTFPLVLALATTSGKLKQAAILVEGPDPSKEEYKRRAAFFPDKAHWQEFVKLWNQARNTPAPSKSTNSLRSSTAIGSCFDAVDATMAMVSVNEDGTIQIDVIDSDKWPMMFRLQPGDFDEFGSAVAKVTAYFGN
jgi:hypothetical protein